MTAAALPRLRDDLRLHPGPRSLHGEPTWTIHDPVRNSYIRIGSLAFHILSAWHLGTPDAIAKEVAHRTGRAPKPEEMQWLMRFLHGNSLLAATTPEDIRRLAGERAAHSTSRLKKLVSGYLFFRIPLLHPDAMLRRLRPLAEPLYSSTALLLIGFLGLTGLLLVMRQWDAFTATFLHFYSWEGALLYAVALTFAKVIHEMGHAMTAVRYGLRIPTMGLGFIVLWPVLYTDTGDAWKLTSQKKRLAVSAAGMIAELGLACMATFLWSFLPDGPVRSAVFLVATVTWIMTLAVNLNPLMRFDGYYLLSDILGVENLQNRAFAMARWRLREMLFGVGDAPPEALPSRLRRTLPLYGYAMWIYRFFLYLGIAVLVYHLVFKVLGLVLFSIELLLFIVVPLYREARVWWRMRHRLLLNRQLALACVALAAGMALLVYPWQTTVRLPAVMRASEYAVIYAPASAQVAAVHIQRGDTVQAGQALLELAAPDLESDIAQARLRIHVAEGLVARQAASPESVHDIAVLRRRLIADRISLEGLLEKKARLVIRAPFQGRLHELAQGLRPGLWVREGASLALLINPQEQEITAFVSEQDLHRIAAGAEARFIPDQFSRPSVAATVTAIAQVNSRTLEEPSLSSEWGGSIAVRRNQKGQPVPTAGVYRVLLSPAMGTATPELALRGVARVQAERMAVLQRLWRLAASIFIRESGY